MLKQVTFLMGLLAGAFHSVAQTGVAGIGTSATNVFWLKADAGTSSSTNNTPLSFWNDQSGNGINVTQTVSAQQPSFTTNVINGFPAVLFDNVNASNQNDKMIGTDSPLLDNTSGYTFFYATRPVTLSDARVIVSKRTSVAVNQSFMLFYYSSNRLNVDIQTNNDRYASNTIYAPNTNYIGCLIYDGTIATAGLRTTLYNEETFDRNASETTTLVPDNNSPLLIGTTDLGDPRPFGGYIAEVIIYRTALGNAQRIIINNYLSAKYNIALSANDRYAGDESLNGDYDREVAGLGMEATGGSPSFSASISGGITISANSGLDNGDYIMTGHALATNTTITTDVGGMTGSNNARWQRVWYMDVTNSGANMNVNIEFDMSDGGMGIFTPGALSNYVLLYRAGQTGNWTELGTATSVSGDRIIFNSVNVTNDGYVTLGTRNFHSSPLPIHLLTFKATQKTTYNEFNWSTASEQNNDFFTLEKSKDGEAFETVDVIKGAGNSSILLNYVSRDNDPFNGITYYRLKQTDYDGKSSYYKIIAVDRDVKQEPFFVFPNPSDGNFKIKLPLHFNADVQVTIHDGNGKLVFSEAAALKDKNGFYTVQGQAQFVPGQYVITLTCGGETFSSKIIIK